MQGRNDRCRAAFLQAPAPRRKRLGAEISFAGQRRSKKTIAAGVVRASSFTREAAGCSRSCNASKSSPWDVAMTISPSSTQRGGNWARSVSTSSGKYRFSGFRSRLWIRSSSPSRNTRVRNPSHFGSKTQESPEGSSSTRLASIGRQRRIYRQVHAPWYRLPASMESRQNWCDEYCARYSRHPYAIRPTQNNFRSPAASFAYCGRAWSTTYCVVAYNGCTPVHGLSRSSLASLPVEHHYDAAGNHWMTLPGASERALVLGSHLDSVPNGGWLDGCLGVVTGLRDPSSTLARQHDFFGGHPAPSSSSTGLMKRARASAAASSALPPSPEPRPSRPTAFAQIAMG